MNVVYLLSSVLPYEKLICSDAGPKFAADYCWQSFELNDPRLDLADVIVVDTRIQSSELPALRNYIERSTASFVLRICDPFEHVFSDPWFCFVRDVLDRPRIHVMLNYSPAAATAWLYSQAKRSKFIKAPYVYIADAERKIDHSVREHKVIVTGAINRKIYPRRCAFIRAATWWLPLSQQTRVLPHPGYPDLVPGADFNHKVVGDDYVSKLSEFRFAFACSSVARIELMKYREFAYAGVVPVGDMPSTFMDCPAGCFIAWRRNAIALARELSNVVDTEEMAKQYRAYVRHKREASKMREWVGAQLSGL